MTEQEKSNIRFMIGVLASTIYSQRKEDILEYETFLYEEAQDIFTKWRNADNFDKLRLIADLHS